MTQFIDLREIQSTDSAELVKLKKRFNALAAVLNLHCHYGMLFSKKRQCELIHDLYLAGKKINEFK